METKKDVGEMSLRAYPWFQAFALPLEKDKQRKACPRQVIYTYTLPPDATPLIENIRKDSTPCRAHLIIYTKGISGVGI